ncbi:hypothetical protein T492DRAFT_841980 [Pavlovales sp. CCMP2436]|nr:hypothetical protein T492DRAFT_841980 [Pavlovales sp. CCMP2436]
MEDLVEAPAAAAPRELLPIKLDILAVVKTSQSEHGLRHGDYDRYRTYCTKRMRRLRKSVGFAHGSKGKYAKRVLRPDDCTDSRHLLIPLMNAERAWAYAMHLKRESGAESRPRHHMLTRLAKAARWASELQALCAKRGDHRTALEAEAYGAWMSANHMIERENWASALRGIFRARTIYAELSRVTLFPEQQVYREMVEEIDPIQRYCRYQLQTAGGDVAAAAGGEGGAEDELSITELLNDDPSSLASSMLRSKLEPILAQLQAKQAQSLDQVVFRQQAIPVTSDKLRVSILRSQELLAQIVEKQAELKAAAPADGAQPARARAKQQDAVLELFDKLLVEDNDALELLRSELRPSTGKDAGKHAASARAADPTQLLLLQRYFQLRKLRHTVRRHLLMLSQMRDKVASGTASTGERKVTTAEDVSRVYTVVLQHLAEMSALLDAAEDAADIEAVDLASLSAKAHRTFYLAASYISAAKWPHARALLERTAEYIGDADSLMETISPETDTVAERLRLELLTSELAGARCRLRASAILQTMEAQLPEGYAQGSMEALSLAAGSARSGPGTYVLDDLDAYVCTALPEGAASNELKLIQFPLGFEPVACKPLLFDVARNYVRLPDLSAFKKQERVGLFSRIWGR